MWTKDKAIFDLWTTQFVNSLQVEQTHTQVPFPWMHFI